MFGTEYSDSSEFESYQKNFTTVESSLIFFMQIL
jgi:hypothetical protein